MIMGYTSDDYCDMLLTLGACSSQAGTSAGEYAFRYLGGRHTDSVCFDYWSSVFVRQDV